MSRFRSSLTVVGKGTSGLVLIVLCLLADWKDTGARSNGMWIDRFGGDLGVNGTVNAIAVNDSGVVYVGGLFSEAGGEDVSYIAKWADGAWTGLGNGLDDDVWGLELTPSGTLYAGGDFVLAGGIVSRFVARWTGEAWEALEGLDGRVRAMAAKDTMLFAGGRFGYSGHGPAYKVAQWDGAYWQEVGGGVECPCRVEDNAEVETLALADEGLYVGGYFLKAGGKPANNIALWDGSNWHALGTGTDGTDRVVVSVVVTDSGDVYVGGDFTYAGGRGGQPYCSPDWDHLGAAWCRRKRHR